MNSVGVINKLQAQHETDTAALASANAEIERLNQFVKAAVHTGGQQVAEIARLRGELDTANGLRRECAGVGFKLQDALTQANATVGRLEAALYRARCAADDLSCTEPESSCVRCAIYAATDRAALAPPAAANAHIPS